MHLAVDLLHVLRVAVGPFEGEKRLCRHGAVEILELAQGRPATQEHMETARLRAAEPRKDFERAPPAQRPEPADTPGRAGHGIAGHFAGGCGEIEMLV